MQGRLRQTQCGSREEISKRIESSFDVNGRDHERATEAEVVESSKDGSDERRAGGLSIDGTDIGVVVCM